MRRALATVCAVATALTATGCSGLGSVATARNGKVRYVLTTAVKEYGEGSTFAGLAVTDDGTVYLGAIDDEGFLDRENPRILMLRRGSAAKTFLREQDVTLQYVEELEPRFIAIGKKNELLVAAYGKGAVSVVAIVPGGQRVIPGGPPVEGNGRYGLQIGGLAADRRDGTVYLADRCRIYCAPGGHAFELFAGQRDDNPCFKSSDPAQTLLFDFEAIGGLAVDPRSGALYVADAARIYRIDGSAVTPIAGRTGSDNRPLPGFSGDGGPATNARLHNPGSMAVDPATGDLYIADLDNQRIRKIDATGTITTAVGNGSRRRPYEGKADDVAVDALQVAIDAQGHLWATAFADRGLPREIWSDRLITTTLPRP